MVPPVATTPGQTASPQAAGTARVACIGAGAWGRHLVRNFHSLGVLATICDSRADVLHGLRPRYRNIRMARSADEVLGDSSITAVVIATPAETHADLVRAALLADKDVLVERPLAVSAADAAALVGVAEAQGRVLMVGHLLWYHPAVLRLKELVTSGELGRLRYIYSNRLNLGTLRREENIHGSFAPQDISVMLGLVDEMPDVVQAMGGNYLHDEIADVTMSTLSFPSGVRAHLFVSWLHPFKEQKLVVVGERQMAVFDDLAPTDKLVLYPHTVEWRSHYPVPDHAAGVALSIGSTEPLLEECAHFLECVATRSRPRTDGPEAVRVLRVLERCQRAVAARPGNLKGWGSPVVGMARHSGAHYRPSVSRGPRVALDLGRLR